MMVMVEINHGTGESLQDARLDENSSETLDENSSSKSIVMDSMSLDLGWTWVPVHVYRADFNTLMLSDTLGLVSFIFSLKEIVNTTGDPGSG